MVDISFPIALGAGLLSFLSPCILPMIPVYIMYLAGGKVNDEIEKSRRRAFIRTLGFVIGFTIVFLIMGASASYLGRIYIRNKEVIAKASGIIIIFFGLKMTGLVKINFLSKEKKLKMPLKINSWFEALLMGIVFAAGWTPCFGPVLASILIYAGTEATMIKGIYLLLVYSLGMAIPFILTSLWIDIFSKFMNKTRSVMKYIPLISGVILIIFGLMIFFNKVTDLSRIFV